MMVAEAEALPTEIRRAMTRLLHDEGKRATGLTLSPANFLDADHLPTRMWAVPITYDSTMAVGEFTLTR